MEGFSKSGANSDQIDFHPVIRSAIWSLPL